MDELDLTEAQDKTYKIIARRHESGFTTTCADLTKLLKLKYCTSINVTLNPLIRKGLVTKYDGIYYKLSNKT